MTISRGTAVALCSVGMALVGSSVAVSQLLLDYPMLTGQAMRYAVAALALFAVAAAFPRLGGATPGVRPTARELGILAIVAATGMAGFNACILVALHHTEPAVVGTVIGAAPLGLALLGPLLRGARPTTRIVAAAAIVVAGTALVEGTGHTDLTGLLATFGALAGEILFSLLAALVLPRLGPVRVAAYSCALAVPMLLVGALALGEPSAWRLPVASEAMALAYLAVLMTVVAFVVWFIGLQRLGVERAGILVGLMPIATLATAAVMAGALPSAAQTLGVLTVAVGLSLGLRRSRVDHEAMAEESVPIRG